MKFWKLMVKGVFDLSGWCHDIPHVDTKHNDTQNNHAKYIDTQHNGIQSNNTKQNDSQQNDTEHNNFKNATLSIC
jgi:hypothetical protein